MRGRRRLCRSIALIRDLHMRNTNHRRDHTIRRKIRFIEDKQYQHDQKIDKKLEKIQLNIRKAMISSIIKTFRYLNDWWTHLQSYSDR
jgi:hypothetical protein